MMPKNNSRYLLNANIDNPLSIISFCNNKILKYLHNLIVYIFLLVFKFISTCSRSTTHCSPSRNFKTISSRYIFFSLCRLKSTTRISLGKNFTLLIDQTVNIHCHLFLLQHAAQLLIDSEIWTILDY